MGVGNVQIPNLNNTTFLGLNALDVTTAQQVLSNLAGTVASVTQQYWVNSPSQTNWSNYQNGILILRDNHDNQWSGFFKDNWKVTRSFTVNLGVRYDWYGTPYMSQGLGGKFVGGSAGLFGISGTNFANAATNRYQTTGPLSTTEFTGPNSPHPGDTVYNNDNLSRDCRLAAGESANLSLGPSVGISWQVPWFKRSTIFRAGYGMNYVAPLADYLAINTDIGGLPGQTLNTTAPLNNYVSIASLNASGLVPVTTGGAQPFTAVPLTNRTAPAYGYANNLRNPYIQVFNASIQRELTPLPWT